MEQPSRLSVSSFDDMPAGQRVSPNQGDGRRGRLCPADPRDTV